MQKRGGKTLSWTRSREQKKKSYRPRPKKKNVKENRALSGREKGDKASIHGVKIPQTPAQGQQARK